MQGPGGPGGGRLLEQVDEPDPAVKQEGNLASRGIQLQVVAAACDQAQLQAAGRQIVHIQVDQVQRDHPGGRQEMEEVEQDTGLGGPGRGLGSGGTW